MAMSKFVSNTNARRLMSKCASNSSARRLISSDFGYSYRTLNTHYSGNLTILLDEKLGYATVNLSRPPVNALNLEFIQELTNTFSHLEQRKFSGIILTSNVKSVFCAGMDLLEMFQPEEQRLRELRRGFQEMWLTLYGLKMPVVAAINGHSPAAGCLLAMCADYRIMLKSDKYKIGFNEGRVGLIPPFWLKDTFSNTVGHKEAEFGLKTAKLYPVDEALAAKLIDDTANDNEMLLQKSKIILDEYKKCEPSAMVASKHAIRQPTIDNLISNREKDIDNYVNHMMKGETQRNIAKHIKSLRARRH